MANLPDALRQFVTGQHDTVLTFLKRPQHDSLEMIGLNAGLGRPRQEGLHERPQTVD